MKWMTRALVMAALVATAQAQPANPLPQGTVTLVVPLAAGGPLDALARVFGERLASRIGRNVIIENKAGAGGNIGASYVAKSKPDGLTWLYTIDSVVTVNPHIYASQGFDAVKDLVPAARMGHNFNILAVNAKRVEAKTFAELLALSKTRSLSFASAGIGSPGHLAFEYLRVATDMKGEHVPYRGAAPALQDLVAGVVDAAFVTAGAIMPHVESGSLRALATSTGERASQMPNVPTAEEAGIKGFEARFGNYLMSPAGVDPAIRVYMAEQLREIMKDPDVQRRMILQGSEPVFGNEQDSIARIAADRAKWASVMKAAGVKAE
jgi:tripartite-type tricarboxylate transporter receptor subunit TctC